jgi:hypothetical protein
VYRRIGGRISRIGGVRRCFDFLEFFPNHHNGLGVFSGQLREETLDVLLSGFSDFLGRPIFFIKAPNCRGGPDSDRIRVSSSAIFIRRIR